MKKILVGLIAISLISFTACNNGNNKEEKTDGHDMNQTNADSAKQTAAKEDTPVTEIMPTFTNVDGKVAASIKEIVDHYLHLKNALVNDNGSEAATASKEMAQALTKVDKSLFTADQKKVYDDIEDDLQEHAEHIGKNAGDIEHQREHFSMMSEDVYDLVKAFGAGRVVYHDHCPMANDNKGAMWLSETKDVKNPYFGGKMNNCVHVVEMIK